MDIVPGGEWGNPSYTAPAGATLNVSGDGFPPGAEVHINLGRYQTDAFLLDDPVVYADAAGRYSMQITLGTDLAPGPYGLLVWYAPFAEDHKRYALIEVTAP